MLKQKRRLQGSAKLEFAHAAPGGRGAALFQKLPERCPLVAAAAHRGAFQIEKQRKSTENAAAQNNFTLRRSNPLKRNC